MTRELCARASAAPVPIELPSPGVTMIPTSLQRLLSQRRTLLLQGPMGSFFKQLESALLAHGQEVWKVNFNAGDDCYFRGDCVVRFRDPLDRWPARLRDLLGLLRIDAIVLFGQSRSMHEIAIEEAKRLGISVYVFEEGYVRPDYVTLEVGGVNAASPLPRDPAFYRMLSVSTPPAPRPTGQKFAGVAMVAALYAIACAVGSSDYPHYRHHRSIAPIRQSWKWAVGLWRKAIYCVVERHILGMLTSPAQHKRFFLVPLQVYNDSQIRRHSRFNNVSAFIREVLESFAKNAAIDQLLVFKHHPMDQPYNDYTELIARDAGALGIADRVHYIHDQYLPTLLRHARGVVTINSTTGLQALSQGTPVIPLGQCLYAIDGLVHPGPLASFWRDPGTVDATLCERFRAHLVHETQLNESFYAPTMSWRVISQAPFARAAAGPVRGEACVEPHAFPYLER